MSELQLALLGIGALVVIGVLAYNKLQEARLKRQSEEAFGARHDDVLLGGKTAAPRPRAAGERIEPTLSGIPGESAATEGEPDAGIDFIVTLEAQKTVGGDAISAAIVDGPAGPGKPVSWEGYNQQTSGWEPMAAAGAYQRLRAAMQLADRNGAAGEQDFANFGVMVQAVATAIGAQCALAEHAAALARAQRLDALCADVDVQIGLNLAARGGAFAGTKIRAFAEANGFSLERDGRFCCRDDAGLELYAVSNAEAPAFSAEGMKSISTRGLTLLFDVARAPGGLASFDRFARFARALAETLGAGIVDDNRRPLDDAALGKIRGQLQALYASMEQQGIPAGSPLALRLFS